MEKEAWTALLQRKAKTEKKVSLDSLLGREPEVDPDKVVSIKEHQDLMKEMEKKFAK
ncbi:hypothetical protein [Salibacterium lacus]|uniref:Uncharacterized protein n=1 Tax=Salibacterium lacus TaxID=1898109 RepID=A0ABW5SX03_9BACI